MTFNRRFGTPRKPAIYKLSEPVQFGGKTIPANTEFKAYETQNFGFLTWKESDGQLRIAQE